MNFRCFTLTILFLLGACTSAPIQQPASTQSDDATTEARFTQNLNGLLVQVAQNQEMPLATLQSAFLDAKTIPTIRKLVLPPSTTFKKNWLTYRKRFVEPIRLKAGKAFWEQNQAYLTQVERETGVPAEVIVAIIGIETIYGRQMGSFRVKDVLATLAFSYPDAPNKSSREQLFRDQLKELILMCWSEAGGTLPAQNSVQKMSSPKLNACLNQSSSYAGAIGLPQFMPSSIRSYAVDGDGDGRIDLRESPKDAIASVANFLKTQGWQTGMPIYFSIQESAIEQAKALADGEPNLKYTVQDLISKGILMPQQGDLQQGGVAPQSKAFIVDLPYPDKEGNDQAQYVVGLNNFLAIVQYNRSYFYAQSVAEFAQALGYKNQSDVPAPPPTKAKLKKPNAKKKPK